MDFENYTDDELNKAYDELDTYRDELHYTHDDYTDANSLMSLICNELVNRDLARKRPAILLSYQAQMVL